MRTIADKYIDAGIAQGMQIGKKRRHADWRS